MSASAPVGTRQPSCQHCKRTISEILHSESSPVHLAQRPAGQAPRRSRQPASAATAALTALLRGCRQCHICSCPQTPAEVERRCQRTNKQRTNEPAAQQVAAAKLPQQPLHPVGSSVGVRRAHGRLRPRRCLHMPLAARSIAPHSYDTDTVPVCWGVLANKSICPSLAIFRGKPSKAVYCVVAWTFEQACRVSLASLSCAFSSVAEAGNAVVRFKCLGGGAMSGPRPLRAPSKRVASKLPTSTRGAYLLDAAAAALGTAPVFASLLARRAAQVGTTT